MFTVSASPAPTSGLTVALVVADAGHADFLDAETEGGKTVTIPANQASATYTVVTMGDGVDEPSGPVALTIQDGDGYTVGASSSATVTVNDDDATVVSLARVGSGDITEGGAKARFTVSLGRTLAAGETVIAPLDFSPWAVRGASGLQPSDFTVAVASGAGVTLAGPIQDCWIVFRGGAQSATIELAALLDGVSDDGEKIAVELGAASRFGETAHRHRTDAGGGAMPHATANGFETTIGDAVTVSVRQGNLGGEDGTTYHIVNEGGSFDLGLSLSGPLSTSATFHLTDSPHIDPVPEAGTDYKAGPWSVTFAAGETSASVAIETIQDTKAEGREDFRISVDQDKLPADVAGVFGFHEAILVIEDDDRARAGFAKGSATVEENVGTVQLPVTIHRPSPSSFPLWYACHIGGERKGAAHIHEKVTVPANAKAVNIPFEVVDDDVAEEDETFYCSLARSRLVEIVRVGTFRLTVVSNEKPFLIKGVSGATVDHGEAWQTRPSTVNASGKVTWTLSGADASVFAIDAATGAVSLPGQDHGAPADADGNNVYEATVTATDGGGATASASFKVRVVAARLRFVGTRFIQNDVEGFKALEGEVAKLVLELSRALSVPITLSLDDRPLRSVGVDYQATPGVDYPVIPWSATFPAGATRAEVDVPTNKDADLENNRWEYFDMIVPRSSLPAGVIAHGNGVLSDGSLRAYVRIVENSGNVVPTVSFSSASSEVQEADAGTVNLEVAVDPPPAASFALNFRVSGTATRGSDYSIAGVTGSSGTVTVPANAASVDIPVQIIDDSIEDDGETVGVRLLASGGYGAAAPDGVTVTIRNHENAPALVPVTVSLAAERGSVAEADGETGFTLTLSRALVAGETVTVPLAVTGTGITSGDYGLALSSGSGLNGGVALVTGAPHSAAEPAVTFTGNGNGNGTVQVAALTLTAADDTEDEGASETLTVGFGTGTRAPSSLGVAGGIALGTSSFDVAIVDDDGQVAVPTLTISAGADVTEGGDATFTLTASPAPGSALDVGVAVAADGDYGVAAGSRTVSIGTSGSGTLTLATAGDDADEPDGSVTVTVVDGTGYTVGTASSDTVAVQDDDDPSPGVAIPPDLVSQVRALAGQTHHGTAHVNRWKRVLIAFGVEEYPGLTATTAAEARENAKKYSSPLWPRIAAVLEKLEAAPGPEPESEPAVTLPVVTLSAGDGVTEGGDAVFTLTVTPAPSADLAVDVTVATEGDFGVTAGSRTVTIPATGSYVLTIPTTDDSEDEQDGSVTATVGDGAGYTVGTQSSGTVAVQDDDDPSPGVTIDPDLVSQVRALAGQTHHGTAHVNRWKRVLIAFGVEEYPGLTATTAEEAKANAKKYSSPLWPRIAAVLEKLEAAPGPEPAVTLPVVTLSAGDGVTEGGDAVFTLTVTPAPAADLAVDVTVAADGDWGVTAGSRTVTFAAGASTATLTVSTTDDGEDEQNGSVTATLQGGDGYTVSSSAGSATVGVADDDDPPPIPELRIGAGGGVTEGGTASFTITATPAPTNPIAVKVGVSESGDFGASGAATVTVSGASTTYAITTTNDDVDEPDGSVTATLQGGDGYTVSSSAGSATVNVADDDDPPPIPELRIGAGGGVTEGGTASFTITATPAPTNPLTVNVGVSQNGDFGASGAATVTVSGALTTYSVTTADDAADEPDGSVTATLQGGEGYAVSSTNGAATVPVSDDDDPPPEEKEDEEKDEEDVKEAEVTVSIDDARGVEGGYLTFTVRLSAASSGEVAVKWNTATAWDVQDDRAREGEDYEAVLGQFTFEPGVTELTGEVWLVDDGEDEKDEYFAIEAFVGEEFKFRPDAVGIMTIADPASAQSVEPGPEGTVSDDLLSAVEDYSEETHLGEAHVERWLRVLHTLSGTATDATIVLPAEAESHAPRDPARWGPVVEAIRRLEEQAFAEALRN